MRNGLKLDTFFQDCLITDSFCSDLFFKKPTHDIHKKYINMFVRFRITEIKMNHVHTVQLNFFMFSTMFLKYHYNLTTLKLDNFGKTQQMWHFTLSSWVGKIFAIYSWQYTYVWSSCWKHLELVQMTFLTSIPKVIFRLYMLGCLEQWIMAE